MGRGAHAERAWPAAADPESWMDAIRSLIEQEDLAGAKQLAAEAVALFPDDPSIQKMHHFFRPYKVARSEARAPDRSRAFARLDEEASRLRGRWVALSEDDVIASAGTLKELLSIIQPIALDFPALVHFLE
jgi:hypothetical protein